MNRDEILMALGAVLTAAEGQMSPAIQNFCTALQELIEPELCRIEQHSAHVAHDQLDARKALGHTITDQEFRDTMTRHYQIREQRALLTLAADPSLFGEL